MVWRTKSEVSLLKQPVVHDEQKEEVKEEIVAEHHRSLRLVAAVVVGAVALVLLVCFVPLEAVRMLYARTLRTLVIAPVFGLVVWIAAPEVVGYALSFVITKFALQNEFGLEFRGVRILPWFEFYHEDDSGQPVLGRPRTHFEATEHDGDTKKFYSTTSFMSTTSSVADETAVIDDDDSVDETILASSSSLKKKEEDTTRWSRFLRFVARSRLCVEIRVKRFAMTNPNRAHFANWCRDRFVSGTEIELVASMTIADFSRLLHLTKVWSWRPRDQPIRPRPDGGNLVFGAVKCLKSKVWRNRKMLGVIDIERFDLCDAEVAFEQTDGYLNACAVGSAIARSELEQAAAVKENTTPKLASAFVLEHKPNRLQVGVLAARHLDVAKKEAAHDRRHHHHVKATDYFTALSSATTNHKTSFSINSAPIIESSQTPPSTFAYVSVRASHRRSRTIMRNSNPSFGYDPEAIGVTDPSAVVHVTIYNEGRFGNAILGQWAGTLKQLCRDPSLCDGGNDLETNVTDDLIEFKGWLPLRDSKWRPFDVPTYAEPTRRSDTMKQDSKVEQQARFIAERFHHENAEEKSCDSRLHDEPAVGYPAVYLRLRWDRLGSEDFDETQKAMEAMKINSGETACRMGNLENLRAMLSTFPFWLDCRGGFKIRGKATAHVRDLFLGIEGHLERRRRKNDGKLLPRDWDDARRKAIALTKIEVSFPCADESKRIFAEEDDLGHSFFRIPKESVPFMHGYLTLDGALVALIEGLLKRILQSGKVGAAVLHILSAVSAGAVAAHHHHHHLTTHKASSVSEDDEVQQQEQEALMKKHGAAERQALGVLGLRGTRADRQFALLLGIVPPAFKRFDARAVGDLTAPVAAFGLLLKSSEKTKKNWHPVRCVLRGATIFYFRVNAANTQRAGEDHVIDIRRIVGDSVDQSYSLSAKDPRGDLSEHPVADVQALHRNVVETKKDDEGDISLVLKIRRDNGGVYTTYLKAGGPAEMPLIEATAWDETLASRKADTIEQWHATIEGVLSREKALAREEIKRMIDEFRRGQEMVAMKSGDSQTFNDEELTQYVNMSKNVAGPQQKQAFCEALCAPKKKKVELLSESPLNGCWEMVRRGSHLDTLFSSEGISFGTRVMASAAPASLYIKIMDAGHCAVYNKGGFLPSRYVGPLDTPFQMLVVADDPTSPTCYGVCSMAPDNRRLFIAQASLRGPIFFKGELKLRDNDTIEFRFQYVHQDVTTHGLLFADGPDYDQFKRMPPDRAEQLELNAF